MIYEQAITPFMKMSW